MKDQVLPHWSPGCGLRTLDCGTYNSFVEFPNQRRRQNGEQDGSRDAATLARLLRECFKEEDRHYAVLDEVTAFLRPSLGFCEVAESVSGIWNDRWVWGAETMACGSIQFAIMASWTHSNELEGNYGND